MAMTRRALLKAGIGATALPFASSSVAAQTPPPMAGGIQFDVTGLTLFQRWKTTKKLKVVLPDAKRCGLKDAHAPTLMMSYEDFVDDQPPLMARSLYEPTVLRYGRETLLSWSLAGWRVWLGDVQNAFDTDPSPAMTFDDTIPTDPEPTPIDDDKSWSPLFWFADLGHTLAAPRLAIRKPALVTSEIVFTRGHAYGRSPVLCAARYRKFQIGSQPERTYGANLSVWHPAPSGNANQVMLNFTPVAGGKTMSVPVRLRADRPARLTIAHNPLTMSTAPGHVTAYYRLVGKKGPKVLVKNHPEKCPAAMTEHAAIEPQGHPPDSDCVSMFMEME